MTASDWTLLGKAEDFSTAIEWEVMCVMDDRPFTIRDAWLDTKDRLHPAVTFHRLKLAVERLRSKGHLQSEKTGQNVVVFWKEERHAD